MLAQLVEQRTFNPFVVGSIPAHPTRYKGLFMIEQALFLIQSQWLDSPRYNI